MGHVPTGNTGLLELVRFEDALEAANRPNPDYDITKWIYAPNYYSEYRYILGTRGKKPLICVGINPSTAVEHAPYSPKYGARKSFKPYAAPMH